MGTVTTRATPSAWGQNPLDSRPESAPWISEQCADRARQEFRPAALREHGPVPAGEHEQRRAELVAVLTRQRLHRRRIAGVYRGLQPGIVRQQSRHHSERLNQGRALLIDERAGFDEAPLQLGFGPCRRRAAHEEDRGADRQHRQSRAGEKDPVGNRSEQLHAYRIVKSASTDPASSVTTTGRDSRTDPSCQATRV